MVVVVELAQALTLRMFAVLSNLTTFGFENISPTKFNLSPTDLKAIHR
jgi:hypothetical protein